MGLTNQCSSNGQFSTTSDETTVSLETSVLIVANPVDAFHPIKINFPGTVMDGNFTLGPATEVYFACSAVFNGETLIFGGMREPNQFSKMMNCGLKRVGDLPFTEHLYS